MNTKPREKILLKYMGSNVFATNSVFWNAFLITPHLCG